MKYDRAVYDALFVTAVHDLGVKGWRVETFPNYGPQFPSMYIAGKLMWNHEADVDALLELEMEVSPNSHTIAASVLIDVRPGMDRRCFQALSDLPHHPEVRHVWLLNCYHSDHADLMLQLLVEVPMSGDRGIRT